MPDRSKDRDDRADARDARADARDHEADARDMRHTANNEQQREISEKYFKERSARRQLSDAIENGVEQEEAANDPSHRHNRRRRTPYDFLKDSGSIAGACIAIGVVGAWVFDVLPIAKAGEVKAIEKRLQNVESNLGSINIGQKQMQELQLQDRVQKAEDKLTTLPPGSPDIDQWRIMRNETRQRLEQVQAELRAAVAATPR